jgi:hypothetical protein
MVSSNLQTGNGNLESWCQCPRLKWERLQGITTNLRVGGQGTLAELGAGKPADRGQEAG